MVRFEHSQLLSTPLATVWKTIGDVSNWPTLFSELVRVQITQRTDDAMQVIATDSRTRNFAMQVTTSTLESGECSISAVIEAGEIHPRGYRTLAWSLTPNDEQTVLTLKADYVKPWPLVGTLLARLRGRGNPERNLKMAFDAAVRQSHEQVWNYQETVQTILSRKGSNVTSALPTDSVKTICDLIHTHRIGAVLIRSSKTNLVGLVSERDIVYQLSALGPAVLEKQAGDIMTRDLIVCEPQSDLLFVMACMTDNKIRHLPVMDNDELVGVISIGDVVQQRMHSLEAQSDTLKDYIAAREWRFHRQHGIPVGDTATVTDGAQ